ncbi:hypothetical protein DFR24_2499 [Panacagrimonas perspica]|uniref:Uncharacterized protein n=1 Tax=Panacagrimonas perspica TaxID=381431 RepID=A0A4R7P314_9GAMM|nr:hypothetical protein DFR24_2499 [Panacagrimonas perspica]
MNFTDLCITAVFALLLTALDEGGTALTWF